MKKKLSKTLKVKIGKLSNNKTNILDVLIRKNTKAINFCLQKAKEGKYITHNLVYKDLRELNLPATVIHGCRNKSIEIIKLYKRIKDKKTFPILKNSRVRFDNEKLKLKHTNNKLYPEFVSILYKAGKNNWDKSCRIELPLMLNSDYNAGRNLQKLFLAKCQEEQASINYASNIIIPDSIKNEKDDIVRNFEGGKL